jgi:hypothetical protein
MKRFGWIAGTNPTLGNTHNVAGADFFVFRLEALSFVSIRVTPEATADPLDVAFSLYSGILPDEATDDSAYDSLNPLDPVTLLPIASPTDSAPSGAWKYKSHDGFRDTLRFKTTGGVDGDGYPLHPFVGQFDALGSFSMANEDAVPGDPATVPGNWGTVFYILSMNLKGPGVPESVQSLVLPAGEYTIAAGGASCNDDSPACTAPLDAATVSVLIQPVE